MNTEETPLTAGDVLREAIDIINRSHYRLVTVSATFASSDEWILAGYPTAAHWIAEHIDVCVSTAREWIRVGRKLMELPELDEAFAKRSLSYSKVRTLSRIATPQTVQELIDLAITTPVDFLGQALAGWSKRNESDEVRTKRHRDNRRLSYRVQPDGMISGRFHLPPAEAGIVMAAIDALLMRRRSLREAGRDETNDPGSAAPSLAQQRADALVDIAAGSADRLVTELVLHVRADGCTLDDGTPVSDSVVASLVPSAHIRALIHDAESRPIDASGRRRVPTTRQKRVVQERDRRCVDCGSTELLEYDHVPSFAESGRTIVDELELRCAMCHRERHGGTAA